MKALLLFVVAVGLMACVGLEGSLKKDVGRPIAEVMSREGAPTQTAALPNGGTVYTWVQHRGQSECWITLTTDPAGVVRQYSYRGCP